MEREIIMYGLGGQGIVVSSKIMGQAAVLEGNFAAHFASYRPLVRGGSCQCNVLVGAAPIASPPILDAASDAIVMHRAFVPVAEKVLRPGGTLLLNTSSAPEGTQRQDLNVLAVPASDLAEEMGNILVASMIAVGAFLEQTGLASLDAAVRALAEVLPARRQQIIKVNEAALCRGAEFVRQNPDAWQPASLDAVATQSPIGSV